MGKKRKHLTISNTTLTVFSSDDFNHNVTNEKPRLSLNASLMDSSKTLTNKNFSDNLTELDDESGGQENNRKIVDNNEDKQEDKDKTSDEESGSQENNRKIVDNNEDKQEDKDKTSEDATCSPIFKKKKRFNTKSSTSNFGDITVETKKRGKAVDWQTFHKFDSYDSFESSELGKEVKSDFVKHKVNKDGTGVYFCRYGKKKDFKCEVKYKVVKNLDGSWEIQEPLEEIKHNHDKIANTRKYQDYATANKLIGERLDLQVKTRVIRKDLKEKSVISEETSKSIFQKKLYRERVKLNQAAVKINYNQLKEIIEAKSIPSQDVNEPYIVYSSINDSEELRYMMIIRYFYYRSLAYSSDHEFT